VVGVLRPTGTVLDGLLLTPTETVWAVHHHEEEEAPADSADAPAATANGHAHHDHEALQTPEAEDHHDEEPVQITAALFKFRSPMALMTMPRMVNAQTNMQAANPVVEVRRLMTLMSIGTDTLKAIGAGIMLVSALSIFIALYLRLQERRYEMALLRSMGCPRSGLLWLVLGEALILACFGTAIGLLLSRIGISILQTHSMNSFQLQLHGQWLVEEWYFVCINVGLAALAAIIPAVKAFGLNISNTLAHEA
jgi:putative ABC transport system permease protein